MDQVKKKTQYRLVCLLMIIICLKPEFLIPGLKSISLIRQVPNILTLFLFIFWIGDKNKSLNNEETKLYIGFFIVMLLGTLFARNMGRAVMQLKGSSALLLIYLTFITYINSYEKLNKIIRIFLFSNIVMAIIGIKDGGLIKSIPSLADENDFALLMDMLIPFVYFFGIQSQTFSRRLLYFALLMLFATGVIVSFSRGGFIGLVCSMGYCIRHTKNKLNIILILISIIVGGLIFTPKTYWNEIKTISEGTQEHTAATRIYLWKNAIKIFLHHPIMGVGPLNSGVWITTYDKSEQGARDWGRALHSVYFTVLSETGVVGSIIFLLILMKSEKMRRQIRELYKKALSERDSKKFLNSDLKKIEEGFYLSHALTGALIGYLASGIFLSVLYYWWYWMILMYTVILYNLTQELLSKHGI